MLFLFSTNTDQMPTYSSRHWDQGGKCPCPVELHGYVDLTANQFDLKFRLGSLNSVPESLSITYHKLLVAKPQWQNRI